MTYLPRDFIETSEGFIFAVVDAQPEDGRVLGFLRYARQNGILRKLDTAAAHAHLAAQAPGYLFTSRRLAAARLHGVPTEHIHRHYQPRERVQELLAKPPGDAIEAKAIRWLQLLSAHGLDPAQVGLTGSLLIGAHTAASDLDFVLYGREAFFWARRWVGALIEAGELANLDETAWREAYGRRGCALGFDDYLWHEQRKLNKGLIDGTKFDITLISQDTPMAPEPVRKLEYTTLRAVVADARHAYDHPAVYWLDHPEIEAALSFTHTYAGQAEIGETVEIAGMLEETESGRRQIVVGSSREAPGEYIRVPSAGKSPA